jgi:hypothetical protein
MLRRGRCCALWVGLLVGPQVRSHGNCPTLIYLIQSPLPGDGWNKFISLMKKLYLNVKKIEKLGILNSSSSPSLFNALLLIFLFTGISIAQPTFESLNTFGGTGQDGASKIKFDANGNQFIIGSFEGTVDFDPSPSTFNLTSLGQNDIFILKLNNTGNFLWVKRIGGTGSDIVTGLEINSLNEIIISAYFQNTVDFDPGAGTYNLTAAGQQDFVVEKLDNNGNFIFCKSVSGPFSDIVAAIEIDSFDNIYTTGWFTGSNTDFDPGVGVSNLSAQGADIFVWKLDLNGNFVWAKKFGGSFDDTSSDLKSDNQGNVIFIGQFLGTADFDPSAGTFNLVSNGSGDVAIAKLSPTGSLIWAKNIGGTSSDLGRSICIDNSNSILFSGVYSSTVDFDPGTGVTNLTSNGSTDIFLLKFDQNANFIWAKSIGGTLTDNVGIITKGDNNSFYFTGNIQGTVDLDPGLGTTTYTSSGLNDFFFSLYDNNGNLVWVKTIGGTGDDGTNGVFQFQNYLYLTGSYSNTVDFDPNTGIQNSTSFGSYDAFILRLNSNSCSLTIYDTIRTTIFDTITTTIYDTITTTIYDTISTSISVTDTLVINATITGVNPPNNINTISIYPNPANTHITIDNGNFALMNGYTIRINNALGQTVFNQTVNQQQFYINLSGWTGSGYYYLDLIDNLGNTIENKVIVVQ